MISSWDVLSLIWAVGVAHTAPRILKRWSLITTCDPIDLCQGCRDERRHVKQDAMVYDVMGPVGGALQVLIEASIWYLQPFIPALRKLAGREPLPTCSKGSCLAYTRRQA
ncbi:hypothetical protein HD597_006816 [Nonomuraea thailandensis]|uniref:Uncharacterized protein n=1 Tax=Nonomuraea thailandensis TaxID=1188745 RepID=A0A9X2GJ26_9ACTN|nr:hypothetical protein [Nonomuraea thailandensis]MCP2359796.1 hypothetical protein [Nonomuraea thailandensis]